MHTLYARKRTVQYEQDVVTNHDITRDGQSCGSIGTWWSWYVWKSLGLEGGKRHPLCCESPGFEIPWECLGWLSLSVEGRTGEAFPGLSLLGSSEFFRKCWGANKNVEKAIGNDNPRLLTCINHLFGSISG